MKLRGKLADLHAERVETWDAGPMIADINQRARLVAEARRRRFVSVGDAVADFEVPEVDGTWLRLSTLLTSGPVVLVFFRFACCPTCNIALSHYNEHLAGGLCWLGATLVALSPQIPQRLIQIKARHRLNFDVASDTGNVIGRRLGITYEYDQVSRAIWLAQGHPIGQVTGTGTWELPMPAIIVIDGTSKVTFADVSPDWLVRTEAEDVLAHVQTLRSCAAA